jgi:hypothetical protein
MATYRILYWQDVPSQIRAEDETGDITVALPPKFMERIDTLATELGLVGSDDYLAEWHWSDEAERDGTAQEVADALCRELDAKAVW